MDQKQASQRKIALRKEWGSKPCAHPRLEEESNLGFGTGKYFCLTCGGDIRFDEAGKPTPN
jgi:hypothetical protein